MTRAALFTCLLLSGCGPRHQPLSVAAASNLTSAFDEIGSAFTRRSGVAVVFNFASTAQLAHQVDNAAPFDVFAGADVEHVVELARKGRVNGSATFARGSLVLWSPSRTIRLNDLLRPDIRYVAIARPASAPFGRAAVDALAAAGLWKQVEPKVVYAPNVQMAKQLAATGNADAAFTAGSLVLGDPNAAPVDERLHKPLDMALAVVSASPRARDAQRFTAFVLGAEGQAILKRHGYR